MKTSFHSWTQLHRSLGFRRVKRPKKRKNRLPRHEVLEARSLLAAATVSAISGTVTSGQNGTFAIGVSPSVNEVVEVGYKYIGSDSDDIAGGVTSGAVTFTPNQATPDYVTFLAGYDNDGDAGTTEPVTISLTSVMTSGTTAVTIGSPATATVNVKEGTTGGSVSVSVSMSSQTEGLRFTANGSVTGLTGPTMLSWNDSASDPSDISGVAHSGSTTVTNGAFSFTVPTVDDQGSGEGAQTLTVSVRVSSATASTTAAILEDNDSGTTPTISIGNASADETGGGEMVFTLSLSQSTTQPVTVTYSTVNGSATAGTDYEGVTDAVATIPAGSVTATVSISVLDDGLANEPSQEQFTVTLSSPVGATLGTSSGTGTIDEDSDAEPVVDIFDSAKQEQSGTMYFLVLLTPGSATEVDVPWSTTTGGNAIEGTDYISAAGTLTFAPGQESGAIAVPILDDTTVDDPNNTTSDRNKAASNKQEPYEEFTVTLQPPTNATLARDEATGTIYDGKLPRHLVRLCPCTCGCPGVEDDVSKASGDAVKKATPGPGAPNETRNPEGEPYAVITVQDQLSPDVTSAKYVEAVLTFGGVSLNPVYYNAASYSANQIVDFAQEYNSQTDGGNLTTGTQPWTMTIIEDYANPVTTSADIQITRSYTGTYDYENLDTSPFGKGWMLQSLDRLYPQSGGSGVELADGAGNMYWYASNGSGGFATPPDAPGSATLSATTVSGSITAYTLTDENQNVEEFNASGFLTAAVDSNGNTTSYSYGGPNGDLSDIVNQAGQTESFAYNTAGYVTSVVDFNGRTSTYAYDASGDLTEVIGPNPNTTGESALTSTFSYNTAGQEISMAEEDATTTYVSESYTYDSFGALTAITDALANTTQKFDAPQDQALVPPGQGTSPSNLASLVYDSSIAGTQTDENTHTTTYNTGIYGEVTSTTDPVGAASTVTYNDMGEPLEIDGPELSTGPDAGKANKTTFQYDANGNLVEETLPDGSSESWTYNLTFNEVTSYTDPMGRVTDYALDPSTGNVLSVTQVGTPSRVTSYTYTPKPTGQGQTPGGLLATETDPRGIETEYFYNTAGLVTEVINAAGTTDATTTSYSYDSHNDLTAVTTTNVNTLTTATSTATTTYVVDGVGRTIETDSPAPNPSQPSLFLKTTDLYDAFGNVISETVTNVNTLTTATTTATTTYQYSYKDNENAELTKVIQPDGTSLTYSFDPVGNLTQATDAMGRVTSYAFDADNRQISQRDPNPVGGGATGGPSTSVSYDLLGNVIAEFDAASNETDNTYDLRGDLLSTVGPAPTSGGSRPTMSYAYNADQEITSETDALGRVTYFTYNEFGELTQRQDPSPGGTQAGPITTFLYL